MQGTNRRRRHGRYALSAMLLLLLLLLHGGDTGVKINTSAHSSFLDSCRTLHSAHVIFIIASPYIGS